jgi:hypothetical protein
MDEQSKNEMMDYLWMEYAGGIGRSIASARFYEIPIASIGGAKIGGARLRMSPSEIELYIEVKNGDNPHINYMKDYNIFEIVKNNKTEDADTHTRHTKLSINEGVEKLINIIGSLDFSVRYGTLVKSKHPSTPPPKCFKKLASLGKAECDDIECCVCLEDTETRFTPCNHRICGICVSNLKKMICPMCRADYQECDDDDDSSGSND